MEIPQTPGGRAVQSGKKLGLEWITSADGVALFFDKPTWKVFQDAAHRNEQSAEHMVTRAVVGCLGTIAEDNMVLNRILRASDTGDGDDRGAATSPDHDDFASMLETVAEMKRVGVSAEVDRQIAALINIFERMYRRARAA